MLVPPTPDEISFAREGNEIPIEAALKKPKKSITENNSVQGFDQKNWEPFPTSIKG